jgi:hypothetical protein
MSDRRLYQEMNSVLKAYDENKVKFLGLVNRLEECADHIADDPAWLDTFRSVWGQLEVEYAYAASMDWKQIPEDRMPYVLAALAEIRQMVSTKLAQALPPDAEE